MLFIARVFWLCQGRLALKWPSAGRYMTLITVEIRFQGSIPTSLRWPVSMHLPQLTAGVSSCGWWANTRNKSSTRASGKEGMSQGDPRSRVHQYASKVTALLRQHPLTENKAVPKKGSSFLVWQNLERILQAFSQMILCQKTNICAEPLCGIHF